MDPGGPDPHDCCPPGVIKSLLTNLFGLVYTALLFVVCVRDTELHSQYAGFYYSQEHGIIFLCALLAKTKYR